MGGSRGRGRRRGLWRTLLSELDEAGPLLEVDDKERRKRERGIVDALARETSRAGLGSAGIFLAEGAKPLSGLVSNVMHLFSPTVGFLLGERRFSNFAFLVEDRSNLERFASQVERLDEKRGWGKGKPPGRR